MTTEQRNVSNARKVQTARADMTVWDQLAEYRAAHGGMDREQIREWHNAEQAERHRQRRAAARHAAWLARVAAEQAADAARAAAEHDRWLRTAFAPRR